MDLPPIGRGLSREHRRLHGYEGDRWIAYFWFVGWAAVSLGLHVHLRRPFNVEIHVPFGFFRFGRREPIRPDSEWEAFP